jgi:ethanolamine-phosphate phospho-lyase
MMKDTATSIVRFLKLPVLGKQHLFFFQNLKLVPASSIVAGINNVSHVGHSHPRVAASVSQQLFTLNTNSRYLHEGLVTLAERLSETLPCSLQTVYPVVSGSEANDLAWRIACSYAEKHGLHQGKPLHVCVVDSGYHGHTSTVIDLSPYKFWGPGGRKKATHVHVLPCPDVYRGKHLDGKAAARNALAAAAAEGGHMAAFFCESIISCGGQIFLPDGWLEDVYTEMKHAGVVCVADEVQCGFGRVGSDFWAFQTHKQRGGLSISGGASTAPDIVTMGKPMGNGFPCAAVVTTPALAAAFDNGMEFFATYGGCTAAAAAALAVLDVLKDEKLLNNATNVGQYCMKTLKKLQKQYQNIIGDVRGLGLMIGVELITSDATKEPAPATAAWVKSRCKTTHKVLLSTEGPYSSVIKIKPPMCFSHADVDRMVAAMGEAFENVVGLSDKAAVELQKRNEEAVKEVQQRRAALGGYVDI